MTLNPRIQIPDGVTVPYDGQTVDATTAVLARQKAEREAHEEHLRKLDENPEPVWDRLWSWLGK